MDSKNAERPASVEARKMVSRAKLQRIEDGNLFSCKPCDKGITFNAQKKDAMQVIANIVDNDGKWLDTEYYHQECYEKAGEPYGTASDDPIVTNLGETASQVAGLAKLAMKSPKVA